jgi:hypothetical protein
MVVSTLPKCTRACFYASLSPVPARATRVHAAAAAGNGTLKENLNGKVMKSVIACSGAALADPLMSLVRSALI